MHQHEVRFLPDGIVVDVADGSSLTEAFAMAGIAVQLPCGGTGRCGKCGVEITSDPPEPSPFDRRHFNEEHLNRGIRLACRVTVDRDLTVRIDPAIRIVQGAVLVEGVVRAVKPDPFITKTYTALPEPSFADQASDGLRIGRALGLPDGICPDMDHELGRRLPRLLREADFRVTIVRAGERIIGIEPGDTTGRRFGMAFDIGTTTVAGTLMDLADGRDLTHAARLNAQVIHGEDTISRIGYTIEHPGGLGELSDTIRGVVSEIVREASATAAIDPRDIYEVVFAGNTTMSHLFLGIDPQGLAQLPFTPAVTGSVTVPARELGIGINPDGVATVLPNIAGFVGSDTVAVLLACDFLTPDAVSLAVDVGTNGELALRSGGAITVCSTAAGPALEGAQLSCGMRAVDGAVAHVHVADDTMELEVIGDTEPAGICGSGVIDLVAVLLDAGIIDSSGAFTAPDSTSGDIPGDLRRRMTTIDGQPAFVIHDRGDDRRIALTQRDVRQIQLAKGAISAGIALLLADAGIEPADLDEILLAGAFGNYIIRESALRIGLLPDIDPGRIRFVGNAASSGAKLALISVAARRDADRIRRIARHLELAAQPGFQEAFMNAMLFPDRSRS